ncbi:hypothetical protein HMPREF0773_11184 [Staphylococcus aureus subsp. aureus TCH70]|nr:hypothetical protein HMPREF0782_0064 [Staphylococcus aureus subsp. aureus ATCC 51811]EFK82362.1 hypothetical protein HMPREF0773_11184 [Staphylococcus aureus subsp. aureus TCH70]
MCSQKFVLHSTSTLVNQPILPNSTFAFQIKQYFAPFFLYNNSSNMICYY